MSRPNQQTERYFGEAHGLLLVALLFGASAATLLAVWFFVLREKPVEVEKEEGVSFQPTSFAEIEGWQADDQGQAFTALVASCRKSSAKKSAAAGPCIKALDLASRGDVSRDTARGFFETHYTPYRVVGSPKPGRVTGYYEPELKGARKKGGKYKVPVYARPPDLVGVKPDEMRARFNDTLTAMRKTDDGLVPFYTREEIDKGALQGQGLEILYLADPVELFFMQVQGSGRVRLTDGTSVRLGYASKNGHPYTSIGKLLIERGENKGKGMSMQRIKKWVHADRERGNKLLWENKSYVFFYERPRRRGHRTARRSRRGADAGAESRRRPVLPRARHASVRRGV